MISGYLLLQFPLVFLKNSNSFLNTYVSLQDKWRNLLRSSSAQENNRREVSFWVFLHSHFHLLFQLNPNVHCRLRIIQSMPYVPYQSPWCVASVNWQPFIHTRKFHLSIMFLRPNNRQLKVLWFTTVHETYIGSKWSLKKAFRVNLSLACNSPFNTDLHILMLFRFLGNYSGKCCTSENPRFTILIVSYHS